MQHRGLTVRTLGPIAAVLALGIAASVVAFVVARRADDRRVQSELETSASLHAQAFDRQLAITMESLQAMANYVAGSRALDAASFHAFARLDHDADDANSALIWAPVVKGPDRKNFVASQSSGTTGFVDIMERGPGGSVVVAAAHDEYLPILFEESYDGHLNAPGFDLLSLAEPRPPFIRARDDGKPVATPPLEIFSGGTRKLGFLVSWPVYSTGEVPATLTARRAAYRGAAVARFAFDEVLRRLIAASPAKDESVAFAIDRGGRGGAPEQVGIFDPATGRIDIGAAELGGAVAGISVQREFENYGRQWTVRFVYPPSVFAGLRADGPWAWLVFGLALTAIIAVFFERERWRRWGIETVVTERTSELRREVVERRRQELAVRSNAERIQAVVDTSVHGMVIIDRVGTIEIFNPAAERLFGYRADEVIGQNVKCLMPPPYHGEHDGYLENYHRTGERKIIGIGREVVGRRKDGSTFPMDLAVGEARQNGASIFVGVIIDLTERQRAEAALRLWNDAFANAAFGIAIHDAEADTFRLVNTAMAQMHGRMVEEMQATPIGDAYAPEERDRLVQMLATADGTGHVTFESHHIRPDGAIFPVQVDITSVKDDAGKVLYRIASIFDTSTRRQVEDQLRQSQKMEAIGNLTGGMAHDFNNLLGVVIGNLDLLNDLLPAKGEARELADESLSAALRGAELTKRLLAFARRQPLAPQRVALNELVSNIVKLLERTLGEQIVISLDLSSEVWPVVVDPAQLESAITNLATNARDAMPEGGSLTILTANRLLDDDYASLHPEVAAGDYAVIEVSDTGAGMTPKVAARIFEPFYSTKELGKGTGLGLSMVFGFIKQSGGHISVYSEPGVGTTFRLYLPRSLVGVAEEKPALKIDTPRGSGGTVLVVDDNDALRRVVVRQLTELGYRVIEAEDAALALAVLARERVDVLFTDVVMPGGIDGFALAKRAAAVWPSVKVIFTSGFPETNVNAKFGALERAPSLLSKPYRKDELARAIRAALDS